MQRSVPEGGISLVTKQCDVYLNAKMRHLQKRVISEKT